jgi:hypothetical protein
MPPEGAGPVRVTVTLPNPPARMRDWIEILLRRGALIVTFRDLVTVPNFAATVIAVFVETAFETIRMEAVVCPAGTTTALGI